MKRAIILIVLACLALLSGCSSNNSNDYETVKTVRELNDKFSYETATVLKNDCLVQFTTFDRGYEVTIVDEDDRFYYVNEDNLILAVLKDSVRTEKDEAFTQYNAYTKSGVGLYSDKGLTNKIKTFDLNDTVKVLDRFDDVVLVEVDGSVGYMAYKSTGVDKFSTYKPSTTTTPSSTPSSSGNGGYNDSYNDNSNGSGGNDGEDIPSTPTPTPSGNDGEDITLAVDFNITLLSNSTSYKGVIREDDTPAYITIFNRGDKACVTNYGDKISEVVFTGRLCTVETMYIRLDSQEAYSSWSGYAKSNSKVYYDYDLTDRIQTFDMNDKITIVDEVGDRYVVELLDGTIGYMAKTSVSESKIVVSTPTPKPVETPTPSQPSYDPSPAPGPVDDQLGDWTGDMM